MKTEGSNLVHIALAISPQGHLYLDAGPLIEEELDPSIAERITKLFSEDTNSGLLHLGLEDFPNALPPSFTFWQQYARRFLTEVCTLHETSTSQDLTNVPVPPLYNRQEIVNQAPFMKGSDYLDVDLLEKIWLSLFQCLKSELKSFDNNLENYLNHYNPSWNQVGRIYLHLAENKANDTYPFAFLATYTSRIGSNAKLQHIPLKKALQEHAETRNNAVLIKLLLPLQKASHQNEFIKQLVDSNDVFKQLLWTARQAHQFLQNIPILESCGLMVRVPNWWDPKKPSRPQVSVTIGSNKNSHMMLKSIVDFDINVSLHNNETLTESEWRELMTSTENFVKIKGQWVEIDQKKLEEVLSHWKKVQRHVKDDGLSFAEGMRLLAGISDHNRGLGESESDITAWSNINPGEWLKETLQALRNPQDSTTHDIIVVLEKLLLATLRPYQKAGVQWLWLLYNLRLGGCLADDMGLGKTIQVLSLLLLIKNLQKQSSPCLLVVPASLLGNWQAEINRFAPSLKFLIIHSSAHDLRNITTEKIDLFDVIITTYAMLNRMPKLLEIIWNLVVLDEAQMIKNPAAKQTRAAKSLKCDVKLILTGTPIENHLIDLWSLFDFTSPGLLGSRKAFVEHEKNQAFYAAIRTLVGPYILRRLKSDRRIIQDLPDKTEINAFCSLSKQQAFLYQQAVDSLSEVLNDIDSIQRRGAILSYILRFKQICNHPDQWLGYGGYEPEKSGKFIRLQEICEEIAAKQEKVLIFTQFREIIPSLAAFLSKIFGHEGLILHGATPIKQRAQLVETFGQEHGPQFFILSIKAGGTGLNLTNASHVIHFDRWWNPAVENQATDRAYRIGQKKNVLVHKFICKGTIEEKIDDLIMSKKTLSQEILSHQDEVVLTSLSNEDLIKMVSLDIHQVLTN
jgi:non-specific serine/threonine protein kinase